MLGAFIMRGMNKTSLHTRRIVLSALFLAAAIVIRTFTRMYIPVMGESGMRISFHGIFSSMPAILFGPVYGAMVSGLTDFLGFFISPSGGAWLPLHTLHVALGGFIRGWLWLLLKKRDPKYMRLIMGALAGVFIAFGAFHMYALRADGITRDLYQRFTEISTDGMFYISRLVITRAQNAANPASTLSDTMAFTTTAMLGAGALLLLLLALDIAVRRFMEKRNAAPLPNTLALAIAMLVPAILVSTANTIMFRYTIFTSWQLVPLVVVWLPRVLSSIATTMINVFFIAFLMRLFEKEAHLRTVLTD